MRERSLSGPQVAALLVSATYGIGFLFGSGELALEHGMGGSVYGVATALGMVMLAAFAKPLWAAGKPVWDLFGQAYGDRLKSAVACLSLVWMAGVLAAQIHGGLAVVRLLGLSGVAAHAVVMLMVWGASRLDLRLASSIFAFCLIASGAILAYALAASDGVAVYCEALPRFAEDLRSFDGSRLLALMLGVVILVCLGADYHQFVVAARGARAAVFGCVLAAVCLMLVAFLPPAVVVALKDANALAGLVDAKQAVPFALARVAEHVGPGADKALLVGLSAAAVGSGAAIVGAMTSALAAALPGARRASHPAFGAGVVVLGALVAARGQGIVDTMVSMNVIYIASVGVTFVALLSGLVISTAHAAIAVAAGFGMAFAVYLAGWAGLVAGTADLLSLTSGLVASACAFAFGLPACMRRRAWASGRSRLKQAASCLLYNESRDFLRKRRLHLPVVPIQVDLHRTVRRHVDQAPGHAARVLGRDQAVADARGDAFAQGQRRRQVMLDVPVQPEAEAFAQEFVVQRVLAVEQHSGRDECRGHSEAVAEVLLCKRAAGVAAVLHRPQGFGDEAGSGFRLR